MGLELDIDEKNLKKLLQNHLKTVIFDDDVFISTLHVSVTKQKTKGIGWKPMAY